MQVNVRTSLLVAVFACGVISGLALNGKAGSGAQAAEKSTLQAQVDDLVAKDAIREQIYNYARGLDRMDRDLALKVWHPEGTADYLGQYTGPAAGFIDRAWSSHSKLMGHSHQMTNIIIKVNGNTAASETYLMASLRSEPDAESSSTNLIRGRYADKWSKRNGRWAIDHRVMVIDFSTRENMTTPNPKSFMRRDRTDPSYRNFPF
jgi:hypothetical protein